MKKLNILIVISNYAPIFGGAEKQAQLQAEKFSECGHSVSVLTALRGDSAHREILNNVTVTRLRYPKIKLLGAIIFYAKVIRYLVFKGRKFDVYHVHMVKNLAFIVSVLGAIQDKKVLLKFTGWWELKLGVLNPELNNTFKNRLLLWGLRKANHYISISTEITQKMIEVGLEKEKISYIPNGVDMAMYREREATQIVSDSLTVLFVGRLVEEKGLFVLLDAWQLVISVFQKCRLDIVGDGYLGQQLKEKCVDLGIQDTVFFLGKSNNPATHYVHADIYVLPSFHEGLSNTLLEAMATALPVVSTEISGTVDIIEDGVSGILVPPGLPNQLGEGILSLLNSTNLRDDMGHRARTKIVRTFSIDTVVSQLLSLYTLEGYR